VSVRDRKKGARMDKKRGTMDGRINKGGRVFDTYDIYQIHEGVTDI
jgi:hypothetical protein